MTVLPTPIACRNVEPGTFSHECGQPAVWLGIGQDGIGVPFCDHCRAEGWQASRYRKWQRIVVAPPAEDLTPEGIQLVIPGAERHESKIEKQLSLF